MLTRVVMPENFVIDSRIPCADGGSVAVLIVGYDTDHYIIKGSWGKDIGEDGYFKIKMGGGGSGHCGVLRLNYFPII